MTWVWFVQFDEHICKNHFVELKDFEKKYLWFYKFWYMRNTLNSCGVIFLQQFHWQRIYDNQNQVGRNQREDTPITT